MKTLNLHVDYIKFKPLKKALKSIKELPDKDKKEKEIKEALVVLTAVEKADKSVPIVVKQLVENIKDIASQVKTKNIVLYPYAHLSKDLGSPEIAQEVLEKAEEELKKHKFHVARAPFGYYKEFELKVKGHPLSELSREIRIDKEKEENKEDKIIKEEVYDSKQLLREISKSKLDSSKLKDNDHRILGRKMDLFSFSEVAPGMVFWHNNGLITRNELINFWREEHKKAGYKEIQTPQILDKKLWQISGHWEKYKENIFLTEYEKRIFAVKPMNCPGGILVFKNSPKSYKDLPLRVGELGVVHRQELSGVLGGLFRVIQFTQDDAHIYCTEKQIENELAKVIDLVDLFYKKFGFEYTIELSTRPEKRIGDEKMWDLAENTLKKVLEKRKVKFKINEGDGAFYGPKIDFHLKDSLERTWQCGTIQLDFAMPERFELEYIDSDNKKKRPIMIHRTIYGSLERFIGMLLENTNGRLPTWLAPVQVRVLSFTDRNIDYAEKIITRMKELIPSIRIDFDFEQKTVQSKVKDAEEMKIPYILVIGDKEEKDGVVSVRKGGSNLVGKMDTDEFIFKIREEIEKRI
ncbi:MAG: Threonine--tRNA ligase [Candidatus Diapherotrites archaeon ADurb.Bin253]|jgi:threonyl-tRNA synthetase|nr:threonine--tRNA ligase [Candidatus Pacearchaeota archaeon]OQA66739.1 MAG: Threonine--tRNA ligase [Candidatus Diapherotrites archaeon ADurb.Bin253]HNZ52427.1 threonine--tRNA ligase [Candidatus Pacearchaeota archaeon]HPX74688.1 threonine--tRNA ligase [Candidatus Pacearchaeota archaeon]HQC61138.1 threonine--tRNA ligase [Candidatus Pacearchaeota archaeon]